MSQSLKVYQGEDETPVFDLTEPTSNVHVIFEEVEAGGRAYKGESTLSTFPLRDERAQTGNPANLPGALSHVSISAGSRLEWLVNGVRLFWGRIGPKDYSRGRQKSDRAREVVVTAQDANYDLRNIIVDGWSRPEETDVARVSALLTDYLSGNPRTTTNIADTYVSSSNTVTLGPRVYDATDPATILGEVGAVANKLHFVTIDDELFYDGHDSTTYQAGIRISDRLSELDTDSACESGTTPEVIGSDLDTESGQNVAMDVTVPSGTGALYVAYLCRASSFTVHAANYTKDGDSANNQAMTLIGSISSDDPTSDSDTEELNIFRLVNPAPSVAGSPSVTFSVTGSTFGGAIGYWTVDSTAAPTVVMAKGNGTSSTVTPSAGASDLVLDVVGWRIWSLANASNDPTPTASQTEDWSRGFNNAAGQSDMAWGGAHKVGSGARTWSWTTSTYWVAASITIPSDEPEAVATFPPIWDVGPASTEDGMQLLSGLRLYYGQGSNTYVYVNDPTTANQYWHSEESLYTNDPSINTAARATRLAESILHRRRFEERTVNVSIGPLNEDQVGCLKPGQLISIKARAISYADDQFYTARIAQLKWTTPVPGAYFAHMQLERPIKEAPYGVGPKTATDSINRHVEQGSNSHPEYVLRGTLISQGDLPYRGASDWTRLAIGASNTHLISDGIVPKWAAITSGGGGGSSITPWVLAPENGLANVGTATIGSANAGYVVPATLYVAATVKGMIIRVTAQSGNISVALYDSSFVRLATSGSVACPAVGHAEVNFTSPYAAAAGRYYLGISGSSSTAAFAISGSTGTNASPIHGFTMASAHPLPDPFVNGGAARSYAIAGLIDGGWTG